MTPRVTEGPPLEPVTLRGRHVTLEPLRAQHVAELLPEAAEEELWNYMGMLAHTKDSLVRWVDLRLRDVALGSAIAFLVRDTGTGQAAGSTSLFDYARAHRRIEIGHTWLGRRHRGTTSNPEAKLLLLTHAFETLRLVRVQLKTDPLNQRSRKAILKIGAKEEGTLRNYTTYADGRVRDRVFYSIIDSEWPAVKARLQERLKQNVPPA